MRVLHLITSLGYGGAERLLADLAPRLKARGVDVSVVSLYETTPVAKDLECTGVPVYTLGYSGTIYSLTQLARGIRRLRGMVQVMRPDIVHSHLYLSDVLARVAVPASCPLVTTLHGRDGWWYQPRRVRSRLKTGLDRVSGNLRKVRFISVSKEVGEAAGDSLRVSPRRTRVVANGIPLEKFRPRAADRAPARRIVQIGRFYPEKNHGMALRAFKIVLDREPGARLALIGDGPLRPQIEAQSVRLGIRGAVDFMGVRDDVAEQLRDADLCWMTSASEGLAIACIEAMACGLPVIATAVGGLPGLIADGETGFLVAGDDHDGLARRTLQVFDHPLMASALGRNGRRLVERCYSIEATADGYARAYRELLGGAW